MAPTRVLLQIVLGLISLLWWLNDTTSVWLHSPSPPLPFPQPPPPRKHPTPRIYQTHAYQLHHGQAVCETKFTMKIQEFVTGSVNSILFVFSAFSLPDVKQAHSYHDVLIFSSRSFHSILLFAAFANRGKLCKIDFSLSTSCRARGGKNRRAWSKKEMQSRMSCACAMKLASNTGSGEAVSEDFRSQTSSLFFFTRVLFSIDFLFLVELGACVRRINLGNLLLFSLAWSPVWKWNVC